MSAKWTIQIMRIMDMGHRLMNYTRQLIPKIISKRKSNQSIFFVYLLLSVILVCGLKNLDPKSFKLSKLL